MKIILKVAGRAQYQNVPHVLHYIISWSCFTCWC